MFVVKLAIVLMFIVSGENTVKCLEALSWNANRLLALPIFICSWKIGNIITLELWVFVFKRRGCRRSQTLFLASLHQHSVRPQEYWGSNLESSTRDPLVSVLMMKRYSVISSIRVSYKDFSPKKIRICKLQKIFPSHVNTETRMKSKIFGFVLGNLW